MTLTPSFLRRTPVASIAPPAACAGDCVSACRQIACLGLSLASRLLVVALVVVLLLSP
jgi:hypothetical protein